MKSRGDRGVCVCVFECLASTMHNRSRIGVIVALEEGEEFNAVGYHADQTQTHERWARFDTGWQPLSAHEVWFLI